MNPSSKVSARAYVAWAKEDAEAPNVIIGNFTLFGIDIHALIDLGSTINIFAQRLQMQRVSK